MRRVFGRNLAVRVASPIAVFMAVLMAIGVTVLYTVNASDARRAIEERAGVTVQIIADALAQALWDVDKAAAAAQLAGLARDPDYLSSKITDATGASFAQHGNVQASTQGLVRRANIARNAGGKEELLGIVEIRLSTLRAEQLTNSRGAAIASIGGAGMVATCIMLFVIVRRATKPIVRLTTIMSRLADGDAAVVIPPARPWR